MKNEPDRPLVSIVSESTLGGVARQLELIAREIPKRGIELHMILSCERQPDYVKTIESFRASGMQVDIVPMARKPSPFADLRALGRIRSILKSRNPALVHTHSSKAGILGRRAASSLGIPCLHTPHVFAFEWESGIRKLMYRSLERLAARWSAGIVALSEQQRQAMVANGICHPERVHLIPNGISCAAFPPASEEDRIAARARFNVSPEAPVIGVAARLEPQKGMGNFLRAAASIHGKHPDVVFLIAGVGSMGEECRRRAAELGIDGAVRLCGEVTDILGFYHALDCFMLASLWEGLPYAILEAMACQLPVISTRSFGCEGLISDGETGIAVDLDDVDGLAIAADRILTDSALGAKLGQQARRVVEADFSLNQWADDLAALYRNLSGFASTQG